MLDAISASTPCRARRPPRLGRGPLALRRAMEAKANGRLQAQVRTPDPRPSPRVGERTAPRLASVRAVSGARRRRPRGAAGRGPPADGRGRGPAGAAPPRSSRRETEERPTGLYASAEPAACYARAGGDPVARWEPSSFAVHRRSLRSQSRGVARGRCASWRSQKPSNWAWCSPGSPGGPPKAPATRPGSSEAPSPTNACAARIEARL